MNGNRRRKAWLALAAVVAAGLVLAGCPHNGLLEGGGAGGIGGGSRGGNGGVQLVVTNFVDSGPSRSILPEHIDLTNQAEIEKYVFVASGSGGGTYGPEFIDIAQGSGVAALNISGGGVWNVTVDAYSVDLLRVADQTLTDRQTILGGDVAKVIAQKADAQVLTGRATVDLSGGAQVTMTLTNDGVGTEGDVNVSIYFDTVADSTRIQDNNYDVTVALYNYATGEQVAGTQSVVITGGAAPGNPDVYNVTDVVKGRHQFRLWVSDPANANKVVAYYADDIYVEGNRTTAEEVRVTNLFNVPTNPTGLKVSWSPRQDGNLKDGFLAYFTWSGMSYNAVGMNIEIADITKYYSYDAVGQQHKVDFTGLGTGTQVVLGNQDALWDEIDAKQDVRNAVVTSLSWKDSPQNATNYPVIWQDGSLLNGSNGVTFLMQTGHVYSVRVSAAGAIADSNWFILGDGDGTTVVPPAYAGAQAPAEFAKLKTTGLFGLVEVTYDLEGKYFLYKTAAGPLIGTKAVKTDLVVYHEYGPAVPYTIDKKYNTNMQTTNEGDWFLYPQLTLAGTAPANVTDRIMTWTGWQNKNDPADSYLSANQWKAAGYTGHSNLHLIPVGAGNSLTAQAETSGTFDVLTADTVLVQITADGNLIAFGELTNGDDHPVPGTGDAKTTKLSLMNDAVNNRYILNLDSTGTNKTWLHLSAGADPTSPGVLEDKNGNQFTVDDITVTISQSGVVYKTFDKVGKHEAKVQLDGMSSNDYTLRVEIRASSGYIISYQTPLIIKYNNQMI